MDLAAWIATASAAIALLAAGGALFQARSARQQSIAAHAQVEIAQIQTDLQKQVWMDSVQPYVYVDVRVDEVSGVLLDLVVENTGSTVATDVRIVFDPPLRSTMNTRAADVETPGMPATLSSLPPGRRMTWTLDSSLSLFEAGNEDYPRSYTVRITGEGPFGSLQPLEYVLNVEDYLGSAVRQPGTLKDVAKELAGLTKVIKAKPQR
jgi:hypothetical protein